MPPANTNKFVKGARKFTVNLDASGISDDSVDNFGLTSASGLATDTPAVITIDRVDSNGTKTPDKEESILGIVSGTDIIDAIRGIEGTAQAHAAGAVVEVRLLAYQWNRLIDGILVGHSQNGKHLIEDLDGIKYIEDAGGDDAYAGTLDPAPAAYYENMEVDLKPSTSNTGPCTLNVNGLGAISIKKNVSEDPATGDILAGQMVKLKYDGTNFQIISALSAALSGGWDAYSAVIPTRASADDPTYVLTFSGVDLTSIMSVGMKVSWVQNGSTRFGFITALAFSTNTTMTVYGGTDYDVDDTATFAITGFRYSTARSPHNFPLNPAKWTVQVLDATERTQSSPAQNTWYNPGGANHQISVPIGAWDFGYWATGGSSDHTSVNVALSSSASSVSDSELMQGKYETNSAGTVDFYIPFSRRKHILAAAKTTYYLIIRTTNAGVGTLRFNSGGGSPNSLITAVCAYL
ncbi:MAG: hypothetical protein AAB519_03845 [Patescibacteria group bacterium]